MSIRTTTPLRFPTGESSPSDHFSRSIRTGIVRLRAARAVSRIGGDAADVVADYEIARNELVAQKARGAGA